MRSRTVTLDRHCPTRPRYDCLGATNGLARYAILFGFGMCDEYLHLGLAGWREAPLATSSVRVLVVDDYEPWCRFVCSTLEKQPQLQVIGVVADGLEAVQKAQEMQPDLIVLDIGLPTLNGIEVARRICALFPQSKVLFMTQETSADVVQEALATGARGYVVKADATSELLTALEALLRGERYVSRRVTGHDCKAA
jgi:CheY-like chemotaxis protein